MHPPNEETRFGQAKEVLLTYWIDSVRWQLETVAIDKRIDHFEYRGSLGSLTLFKI
ncbi:hypothetical protein [Aestuariivivens marinum]|uniref:hypothetical protein n=1 Tax=Aestuariivivens marinum TaxID=2913555 RepID=UPI001F596884|nr:hypothetical protein [Aestuariivivens marinum]